MERSWNAPFIPYRRDLVARKAYESLAPQTHSPPPTRNHARTQLS